LFKQTAARRQLPEQSPATPSRSAVTTLDIVSRFLPGRRYQSFRTGLAYGAIGCPDAVGGMIGARFQGMSAKILAIPQKPVIPSRIKPAPTNALSAMNQG
jgi:hypothetical protein